MEIASFGKVGATCPFVKILIKHYQAQLKPLHGI